MVLIKEVVHPGSFDFSNQRKVVLNRDIHKMSFRSIATLNLNVSGKKPIARTVANTYRAFNKKRGCGVGELQRTNCRPQLLCEPRPAGMPYAISLRTSLPLPALSGFS